MLRPYSDIDLTVSPEKSFVGYPPNKLLGFDVDALGIMTAAGETEKLRQVGTLTTVSQLEYYIRLTNHLY